MKKNLFYLCTLAIFCCALTGCGDNTTTGSTSGNNDPLLGENTTEDNVVDDLGDAAMDVADGVGNAVDDLVGENGFDNYGDAHDYFLDTMGSYHSDAQFELRDESEDLMDYQEGSKGYRFSLYDTSNNDAGDMFGEFYVDATSGLIYRMEDDGTIKEYPGKNNSTTGNNSTNTNNKTNSGNKNLSSKTRNSTTQNKSGASSTNKETNNLSHK